MSNTLAPTERFMRSMHSKKLLSPRRATLTHPVVSVMDDDELDRREAWLCALAVRCCRADDVPTPLPDELLSLLRTPLAPWSLLECAADAAEALTAQASNAPAAERRVRK